MTATPTPLSAGTDVGETIGGKLHGRTLITDTAGADAMGLVTASPAATSLLGRLKAIADAIVAGLPAALGGHVASASLSVTPSTDGFAVTVAGIATAAAQEATRLILADIDGAVTATAASAAATATSAAATAASAAAAAPASSGGAVTPSDTTALAAKAIWVGGAGNVVATIGGADVTFTGVPAGTLLPIKATKIKAATTATNIVWLG